MSNRQMNTWYGGVMRLCKRRASSKYSNALAPRSTFGNFPRVAEFAPDSAIFGQWVNSGNCVSTRADVIWLAVHRAGATVCQ